MKEKTNIDISTVGIIYARYRQHILFIITILVCIFLFSIVIIPRVRELSILSKNAKNEANKLIILNNNLNLLSSMDDATLDSQLKLVSSALPIGKDFEGILTAVSQAAINSGVSLSDYDFQVGDLSETPTRVSGFPYLEMSLSVKSSSQETVKFINELYRSFPISEVVSVNQESNSATVKILFYYKPLPQIRFNDSEPIQTVSQKGTELIDKLALWNYSPLPNSLTSPIASSAPSFPF